MADSRLCALAMAWKSPVKWRLMSSIGTTWAYPPPAAPPFTPKTGPSDGSRMQSAAFRPILRSAWVTPTVTVDFPSPAGDAGAAQDREERRALHQNGSAHV